MNAAVAIADTALGRFDRAMAVLRDYIGRDAATAWFASMQFVGVEGDVTQLSVPSRFLRSWIIEHYSGILARSLEMEGLPDRLQITVRQVTRPRPALVAVDPVPATPTPVVRIPPAEDGKASRLDPAFTFDTFISGEENRAAVDAAVALVAQLRGPVYLFGATGTGKTHLLHASVAAARAIRLKALYLGATALRGGIDQALASADAVDVIAIDDLQIIRKSLADDLLCQIPCHDLRGDDDPDGVFLYWVRSRPGCSTRDPEVINAFKLHRYRLMSAGFQASLMMNLRGPND